MEKGLQSFLFCLVILIVFPPLEPTYNEEETVKFGLVRSWAEKLGADLWHFGDYITRRKEVQESIETGQIEVRDGKKLVEQMASDISNMMEQKVSAVRRIVEAAETMRVPPGAPSKFHYWNSKMIVEPHTPSTAAPDGKKGPKEQQIVLTPHPHFGNKLVNMSFSSVHVPVDVYDEGVNVMDGIRRSESLDAVFKSNFKADPSLYWQYFGSSTGFLRHYPALMWDQEPADLYDCRLREWYNEAAVGAKDVIVLVDISGSMTGHRRDIANHIASNILDTLGNNDFVNIFTFSNESKEVVPCFADRLVQATIVNKREFKKKLSRTRMKGVTNFPLALATAFELLERYRDKRQGAECNQAIYLVSDEVPYNFKDVFETYNWRERPRIPVRVFTYLIGGEVADVREVKWMACANRGFFVRLSSMSEVREQVLKYLPVMARPLVTWGDKHPVTWTQVYADAIDPLMTDHLWEMMESEEQRDLSIRMGVKMNASTFHSYFVKDKNRRYALKRKMMEEQDPGDTTKYTMMTSVSMPVFDKRDSVSRVANILGAAGTDVPIDDFKALMMPYQLGVNGYAFIVTNNGFILTHPDLRPAFKEILKASYNSVDMLEVELMDDGRGPRDFNPELVQIRSDIINEPTGGRWMQVKYHFDKMRRVSRIRRQYFWTKIAHSPFSLVVALPEPYGLQRLSLKPEDDIHRSRLKGNNATHYFRGQRWRIHPDWIYCRYHQKSFTSPENELMHFLERLRQQGWHWPLKPRPSEHMHCDRNLIQALVMDAKLTDWFSQNFTAKDIKGKEFIRRFGITETFLSTHSGLTRWQTFPHSNDHYNSERLEFGEMYPRSIDEVWYKRAVEQHYLESSSFVYSVDYDAGERYPGLDDDEDDSSSESERGDRPLVTATHAVFHSVEGKSAPAAVVGLQFHHSSLHALFTNITSSCGESSACMKTCKSSDLDCYVVDNNGYVVVSEKLWESGRFFGEVRPPIMRQLVAEKIFRQVQISDYQAICADFPEKANPACRLLTPFVYLQQLWSWLVSSLFWMWQHSSILTSDAYSYTEFNEEDIYPNYDIVDPDDNVLDPSLKRNDKQQVTYVDSRIIINRTVPAPCDKEVWLYQLQQYPDMERAPYKNPADECERPYVVQPVPGTNLVLVVVDALCPQDELTPPLRVAPRRLTSMNTNLSLACDKAGTMPLARMPLQGCVNYHPNESHVYEEQCGDPAADDFGAAVTSERLKEEAKNAASNTISIKYTYAVFCSHLMWFSAHIAHMTAAPLPVIFCKQC